MFVHISTGWWLVFFQTSLNKQFKFSPKMTKTEIKYMEAKQKYKKITQIKTENVIID